MRSATRVTISTFGVVAGLAALEHGIGEVLQGNQAPAGLAIESWPHSPEFRILGGEPALTIVPNLLITGVLAIVAALVLLVSVTVFVERTHGGLVLVLLSLVMLLVGDGFGPPLLGIVLGVAAMKMSAAPACWRTRRAVGARRFLAKLWPWSLGAGAIAWLLLFPGSVVFASIFGVNDTDLVVPIVIAVLTLAAFSLLLLTIMAGMAYDVESQSADR